MSKNFEAAERDREIRAFYELLDTNKDGKIDEDELKRGLEALSLNLDDMKALRTQLADPEHKKPPSKAFISGMHFLGGTLGGITGVCVSYPLDTVKVRVQTRAVSNTSYTGTASCIRHVYQTEGLGAFYKGITAPMASFGIVKAITFGAYGTTLDLCRNWRREAGTWDGKHTLPELAVAGFTGGFLCSVVMTPTDRIKVQMQAQGSTSEALKGVKGIKLLKLRRQLAASQVTGAVDCARKIIAADGIFTTKGLYRGWVPTAARDGPSMAVYYCAYDIIKRFWAPLGADGKHHSLQNLAAGGIAGQISWLPVYPLDIIKSRLQASSGGYSSLTHCAAQMLKTEGPLVFYRGIAPTLLQAFPLHGSIFMVYELWMRVCGLEH